MPHLRPRTIDRQAFRKEFILLERDVPFGKVVEPWQREDFAALDSGQFRHAYLERPRGHSKTGDLGTEAVVELILGEPQQQMFCAAADADQAKLLFDDVKGKLLRHPALRRLVRITERQITVLGTGSTLTALAADAPGSYGLRPDWIAVDELAEWKKRDLWDALWSATGKRPHCRMLVISTAGWDKSSVAWEVRSNAEAEPDWYFASRPQCASWIQPAWLAQQQRTLPPHVFARLHENRWVDAVGAWLSGEQVDAVFGDVPGADAGSPGAGPVCLGLDLGISRDRAVIAAVQQVGLLAVVRHLETYVPSRKRRVDLSQVEADVASLSAKYHAPVYYDPFQAVGLAQRLQGQGVRMVEFVFSGERRRALFAGILDKVTNGQLRAPAHAALRQELLGLEAVETPSGWRVDHRPGAFDDHVVAVGLALQGLPKAAGEGIALFGRPTAVAIEAGRVPLNLTPRSPIWTSSDERSVELQRALQEHGGCDGGRGGLII